MSTMKITDDQIISAIGSKLTMLDAANSLGMPFMSFRYRAIKLGLYKPNQARKGIQREAHEYNKVTIPLNEILSGLHPHYNRGHLKRRLLSSGLKLNKCEADGCTIINTWNNKPLILQMDHINGDSLDHRLENLRFLCPNCHTQTPTWGRKNRE